MDVSKQGSGEAFLGTIDGEETIGDIPLSISLSLSLALA